MKNILQKLNKNKMQDKMRCTLNGKFKTCSQRRIGGSTYTYALGADRDPTEQELHKDEESAAWEVTPPEKVDGSIKLKKYNNVEEPRFFAFTHQTDERQTVGAIKSSAGAYLALIQRLKKNQAAGIPYSVINKFFRRQLKGLDSDPMIGSFLIDILTYDPRQDTPLTYDIVFTKLEQVPDSIDFLKIWDAIEGLQLDN